MSALHPLRVWADHGTAEHRAGLDGCDATWTLTIQPRQRWPRFVESKRVVRRSLTARSDHGAEVRIDPNRSGYAGTAPIAIDSSRRRTVVRLAGEPALEIARTGLFDAEVRQPGGRRILAMRALNASAICPARDGDDLLVTLAVALWFAGAADAMLGWPSRLARWL